MSALPCKPYTPGECYACDEPCRRAYLMCWPCWRRVRAQTREWVRSAWESEDDGPLSEDWYDAAHQARVDVRASRMRGSRR
jgi:hypothetical protein